jgi:carotenoid 1,2-hydratase
MALRFDEPVTNGAYAWWYIDAISDDGNHGLTLIAFVGSVFSPYYAWARSKHGAENVDPDNHCAINIALYDLSNDKRGINAWAMTERPKQKCRRGATTFNVGPSSLEKRGSELIIKIDEHCAPIPRRLRGTIKLTPAIAFDAHDYTVAIDNAGHHLWQPLAPSARVALNLDQPDLAWDGHGYLDSNRGNAPLENAFTSWQWSRARLNDGSTVALYDVQHKAGSRLQLAHLYLPSGERIAIPAPSGRALPTTSWGIARSTQSEDHVAPSVTQTLENGPFYARSLLSTELQGESVQAVHESLSLTRFASPVVQAMLPFRMPRW